ncbi:cytochrome P450 6g1-like [Haematobia irritans]|uniref:cytochrome P450 6g1-like n=1 Tax=Haematobia irritans TaxID=7368 RepID=UPI003F4F9AED
MLSAVIVACTIGIVLIYKSWYRETFSYWDKHKIPNVRGFFSGSLVDILRMKTNFGYYLKDIYLNPKFQNEPVVGIYIMHRPALLIRDPELSKSVFIKNFDNFRNHFSKPDPHIDPVGCRTLFFSRDKYWRNMRLKLTAVFTSGKLRQMYPLLQAVGANLEKHLQQKGPHFEMEMRQLSSLYTIDTTNTTTFGVASNALDNPDDKFASDIRNIGTADWKQSLHFALIFFIPQWARRFKAKLMTQKSQDFLRATISSILAERELSGLKRNDLIDTFIKIKEEALANNEDMSEFMDSLTGLTWSFMFAGFDTSASSMSYALFELAKNPKIQERLRKEIRDANYRNGGELSYETLNKLEYLDMVVYEAIRMYPAIAITEREHTADEDGNLFSLKPYYDYTLPNGMEVIMPTYGIHYDPKYWPNPHVFDPERFSSENKQSRHPMLFLAFGQGPRNCIGSRLGLLQVKLGLISCLKNHRVQLCERTNLDMELDPRPIVLQHKGGMILQMVKDDMCAKDMTSR